jgi:NADPH:quinone reductase-like Zn-dependent oxidoreductase
LLLVDRPDPVSGPTQVLLKMKAFSLNYRDLLVVNGVGRWKTPLGRVPLSDGLGVVIAAGADVSRLKIGDRVCPIFYPQWVEGGVALKKMENALGGAASDGVLAEYTVFDEASVARVPAHLTDAEAATLPCAAVTAWNALSSVGNLTPGDSVCGAGDRGRVDFHAPVCQISGSTRNHHFQQRSKARTCETTRSSRRNKL